MSDVIGDRSNTVPRRPRRRGRPRRRRHSPPNYANDPTSPTAIEAQLDDIRELHDDAEGRGWTSETARHQRVITNLEPHVLHLCRLRARQHTLTQPRGPAN